MPSEFEKRLVAECEMLCGSWGVHVVRAAGENLSQVTVQIDGKGGGVCDVIVHRGQKSFENQRLAERIVAALSTLLTRGPYEIVSTNAQTQTVLWRVRSK